MRLPRFTTLQLLLAATLVALLLGLFTSAWRAGAPHSIAQICFSPNGNYLAARYSSGTVKVWRLDARGPRLVAQAFGTPPLPREGHQEMLECMYFLDHRRLLKLDSGMNTFSMSPVRVRELDVTTGKVKQVMRINLDYVQQDQAAAFGNHLFLFDWPNGGKAVLSYDLAKGQFERQLTARSDPIWTIALSTDGSILATKDQGGTLAVIDTGTGQTLYEFAGSPLQNVAGVAIPLVEVSADGSRLVVRSNDSALKSEVNVIDTHSGSVQEQLPIASAIGQLAISRDASRLAVTGSEGVECYDVTTKKLLQRIPFNGPFVPSDYIALTPDGATLATAEGDRIWFWDVATAKVRHRIGGTSRLLPMVTFIVGFASWAATWGIVNRRSRLRGSTTVSSAAVMPGADGDGAVAPLGMKLCWGLMIVGGVVALAIPIVLMFVVGPWLFPTIYFSLLVGVAAIARGAARDTLSLRRTAALQLANMVALDPANVVFAAMEYALIRSAGVRDYLQAANRWKL